MKTIKLTDKQYDIVQYILWSVAIDNSEIDAKCTKEQLYDIWFNIVNQKQ